MALTKKDRQQLLALLGVVAVVASVLFWMYWRTPKIAEAQQMQNQIDSLRTRVENARQDLREGTVESLRRRVDRFERSLDLMRQLVPTENEVTNLIDDVSTRAQLRGVQITDISPLATEFEIPYEVYRYRFTVLGQYDQIGEFLADIASLPRIMVPYEVAVDVSQCPPGHEVEDVCLATSFLLRTFVKTNVAEVFGGAGGGR